MYWFSRKLYIILIVGFISSSIMSCANNPQFGDQNTSSSKLFKTPGNKRVLVFVHGIFGDTFETWRNPGGKYFFDLVKENDEIFDNADIFVYGFPSEYYSGGFTINQAADNMEQKLRNGGVFDYEQIIFVCHSMGGLVAQQLLLTYSKYAPKVPLVFFFSTPQEGSAVASVAKYFLNNAALAGLMPIDSNQYLTNLDNQWRQKKQEGSFPIIKCAYETTDTYGVRIVPQSSATRSCDGVSMPVPADHIHIVKPFSKESDAYIALRNAVRELPATPVAPASSSGPSHISKDAQLPSTRFEVPAPAPADVQVSFFPISSILGKVKPALNSDGTSTPIQMDVSLDNIGGLRATGAVVTLSFRPGLTPRVIYGNWKKPMNIYESPGSYSFFYFEDPQIPMYAKSGRLIGELEIKLPRHSSSEELLALYEVHGDFGRKMGLLYYDRKHDEYRMLHTNNPDEATNIWNKNVHQWNTEK